MRRTNRRTSLGFLVASLAIAGLLAGCGSGLRTPTIAINLTEAGYDTPDGMVNDPSDGSVIISMLNLQNDAKKAQLLRITCADGKYSLTPIVELPDCPATGKGAAPLGVAIADDGNLYVADNQTFVSQEKNVSRLLRVVMKDGKAVRVEPVVTGFQMSNAVSCKGEYVYVTETMMNAGSWPLISGVYRFKISDLKADAPIALKTDMTDEHIILKFHTVSMGWPVGANGMAFSPCGCILYVCNFGDAEILAFRIHPETGMELSRRVVAKLDGMQSTDGMKICPMSGAILVADFVGNAIHKVCPASGKVTTLAQNPIGTGEGGALDKPSEVCVFGDKLLIANIDLLFDGNKPDAPQTISVIQLGGGFLDTLMFWK